MDLIPGESEVDFQVSEMMKSAWELAARCSKMAVDIAEFCNGDREKALTFVNDVLREELAQQHDMDPLIVMGTIETLQRAFAQNDET